jgi:F-type H+-transporting ATPase subunit beta
MNPVRIGRLLAVTGPTLECEFTPEDVPALATVLRVASPHGEVPAEVVAQLGDGRVRAVALDATVGLSRGLAVVDSEAPVRVPVGRAVDCRLLDPIGRPLDGGSGAADGAEWRAIRRAVEPGGAPSRPVAMAVTGVRAVDLLCPLVAGGRNGVAGGAGVGKTCLLVEVANSAARTLGTWLGYAGVGARGWEALALWQELRRAARERPAHGTLVYAAADAPAALRARAGLTALTLAERAQEDGHDVALVVDDVYRMNEAGLEARALGRGRGAAAPVEVLCAEVEEYAARVHAMRARSLTTLEAVHLPADDAGDEAAGALLAGLDVVVVLARELAAGGRFPALDPLASRSALMRPELLGARHFDLASRVRALLQRLAALEAGLWIAGDDALADDERMEVARARQARAYLTQSFTTAQRASGRAGCSSALEQTLSDFEQIVAGELEGIAPHAFAYAPDLASVRARAARGGAPDQPRDRASRDAYSRARKS